MANKHVETANEAMRTVFAPGGTLQKAQQAQANGTIGTFLQQLLAELGPIVGPLIIAFITGLLPTIAPKDPTTPPTA